MSGFLNNLTLWPIMLFFMIGVPAAAVGLQALIRRRFPELRAQRHNDVAGFLLAVIAVIYAVTAGFVIANQWENYSDVRERTVREAYTMAAVAEGSVVMDANIQLAIRELVVAYNQAVIDWWPKQTREVGTRDLHEEQTLEKLFTLLNEAKTTTDAQRSYVDHADDNLLDVAVDRDQRLHEANRAHLEGPLWIVISIAGAVTLLFCMLFGLETGWLHYTMIAGIAIIIGISFLLVALLNYPLSGVLSVTPDSYQNVVDDLGRAA